jgi:O-antigen/teichoic acid export membrane protein
MSAARTILKNSLVLLIAQVVGIVMGFLYLAYSARYLGVDGFGIISFATALTGIFVGFIDFGFNTYTIREVTRNKSLASKYLGNIIPVRVIFSIGNFLLIVAIINLMGYPDQTINVVYIIALSIVLNSFTGIINAIFQAYEKMEYLSVGAILNSSIMLVGAVSAIYLGISVVAFAYIYLISSTVVLLYSVIICITKFIIPKIEIDINFLRDVASGALPFGLSGIFGTLYYWIDSVMLSYMQGDTAVGWYNAAYRLFVFILFIPTIFNNALFPAMSRFFLTSHDSFRLSFDTYFKYMAILALPLGVGTTLLAGRIILFIYNSQYSNSILALQILIWSAVFICFSNTFGCLAGSANMQKASMKIAGICMVINVALNLMIIPVYSYIGASVTTVATELLSLALYFILCSRIGYGITKPMLLNVAKISIASLAMGVFIIYAFNVSLIPLIIVSAAFYLVLLYVIGVFGNEDIKLLLSIIKWRKSDQNITTRI